MKPERWKNPSKQLYPYQVAEQIACVMPGCLVQRCSPGNEPGSTLYDISSYEQEGKSHVTAVHVTPVLVNWVAEGGTRKIES